VKRLALLLIGCSSPPPCDPTAYTATIAECTARVQTECVERGVPEEDCKLLTECDERIEKACPK